ncbi:solute carrier family 23 member 3 isoform X3 [Cyanistes caeruleus]|uniref:solute carrier family 23 member 3 isoform X3 n=1 Tax=Cyanistes caeruleus TaxID=156563 RepID=UPI000CDA5049|nr:solute carrier family 23 member 3 isoform X3 [Cyanistes caeruleus]
MCGYARSSWGWEPAHCEQCGEGSSMNGGHGRAPGAGSPMLTSCSSQKICSWLLSCCLALQHLAVQTSLLCIFHLLLLPTLPQEPPRAQNTSKLLARSLFACGISTVLQTTLGSRMPLVQIPSFEYLVPAMVLSSHLSSSASTDRNGTAMASTCLVPHCRDTRSWAESLQEAHVPCRHLLPTSAFLPPALLCLAPCLGGLHRVFSSYPAHILGTAPICWCLHCLCHPQLLPHSLGITGCDHGTAVLGQQHLQCPLDPHPLCRWGAAGLSAAIHFWTGFLSPVPFPSSAGEWRWPLLTPRALAVGIAMAIGSSMNSVGCYVLCGRLLQAPRLPPHACNRGLCMEGLGSLLAGLLGSPGGTASSIANTCATGLTQAGSRLSVQVSALVCMVLGMSPRLAGLLTQIPLAVHGGVLCVTYAVAVGTGISYFQYTDIDSGRNIFIVGFAMFMALLVPRWFGMALAPLATGWVPLDLLFLSLLMVPVFLTGFLSFFLENTVSGTLEERGLLSEQPWKARAGDCHLRGEKGEAYMLPTRLRRLLPSSCKAFPCCFLCPRSEEEEEGSCAIEEGTADPGEGTHLLPKPSSGELQPAIRPSQTDMSTWHTVA